MRHSSGKNILADRMLLLPLKLSAEKPGQAVTVVLCLAVEIFWHLLPEKWAVCLHFCNRLPLVAMADSMFLSIIWLGAACLHILLKILLNSSVQQNKIRQLSFFGQLKCLLHLQQAELLLGKFLLTANIAREKKSRKSLSYLYSGVRALSSLYLPLSKATV